MHESFENFHSANSVKIYTLYNPFSVRNVLCTQCGSIRFCFIQTGQCSSLELVGRLRSYLDPLDAARLMLHVLSDSGGRLVAGFCGLDTAEKGADLQCCVQAHFVRSAGQFFCPIDQQTGCVEVDAREAGTGNLFLEFGM
jgi:hypothetical protein